MNPLLIYLLQVIAASALLYGYYHLALRNKKFHRYNRFYLLAAVVISLVIPFLNIPVYFTSEESDSSLVLRTLTVISLPASEPVLISAENDGILFFEWFTLSNILYLGYTLLALLFLWRIVFSLYKLNKIVKSNPVEKLEKIYFVSTEEPGTPFSFFRWLFWNRKIELQSEKGEQIFRHELFHIQQKHSWDIIFLELLSVVFWINPFFHLMKKELKAIHEFLADEFAINKNEEWQYSELLLMQALNTQTHLVNPFFHNQIKRRIAMITSSQKPGHQYLRKLLVLPVAALVVVLFAFSYQKAINENSLMKIQNEINSQIIQDTIVPKNDSILILKGNITISDTTKPKATDPLIVINGKKMPGMRISNIDSKIPASEIESITVLKDKTATDRYGDLGNNGVILIYTKNYTKQTIVENFALSESKPDTNVDNKVLDTLDVPPSFPGGNKEWRRYLERNLDANLPITNGLKSGSYTVVIQFIVDTKGNIFDLKPLTKHEYGMEAHVIDLIKKGPRWIPGMQNGQAVNAYQKQPVTFIIGDGTPYHSTNLSNNEKDKTYLNEVVLVGYPSDQSKIFDKVDINASFPRGDTAWRNFLTKNLNPNIPVDNGAPKGSYTVVLQFIVHADGHVSDLKALTNHGFGMEKECLRMMGLSPAWNPAIKDGLKVIAYRKQPITFVISSE